MQTPSASYYKNWTALDFAEDGLFLAWVKRPTPALDAHWEAVRQALPDLADEIMLARQLVATVAAPLTDREEADIRAIHAEIEATLNLQALRKHRRSKVTPSASARPTGVWYNFNVARWAVAAAAVVVLAASWIYLALDQGTDDRLKVVATQVSERNKVVLPDGSRVILNKQSILRYGNNWASGQPREVWLEGEAYFEVAKQTSSSGVVKFIVHTGDLEAVVKGTRFMVHTDKSRTEIMLKEGKVDVAMPSGKTLFTLRPNEVAIKEKGSEKVTRQIVWAPIYTSWLEPRVELDNTSLAQLSEMIERGYGKRVLFADPSLPSKRFGGSLSTGDLKTMLSAISKITSTRVTERGDTILFTNL